MIRTAFLMSVLALTTTGCLLVHCSATRAILPADQVVYFSQNSVLAETFLEVKPDGTWQEITSTDLDDVSPTDGGSWFSEEDGVLTLTSTGHYADIVAPPLEVYVGPFSHAEMLPELRELLVAFVTTNRLCRFWLAGDDGFPLFHVDGEDFGLQVDYSDPLQLEVSQKDIGALVSAIDRFQASPVPRVQTAMPMQCEGRIFLLWLTPKHDDLRQICRQIAGAGPEGVIFFYHFLIPEEQFENEMQKGMPRIE